MFCKVGIRPASIHALGIIFLATMRVVLLVCKFINVFQQNIEVPLYLHQMVLSNHVLLFVCHSDLQNAGLSGKLSPELGKLMKLQYL